MNIDRYHQLAAYFYKICPVVCFVILCIWVPRLQTAEVTLSDYNRYRCDVAQNQQSQATFKVLTLMSAGARRIADSLCASEEMSQHFSHVEIEWQPRGFLSSKQLIEQEFDLIWNREYVLAGLVPQFEEYYRAQTEDIDLAIYWFSLNVATQLTNEYLATKTIGLLDDNRSESSFIVPMHALRKAGLDSNHLNIVYYPSFEALFQAFILQEVDIIPGVPSLQQMLKPETTTLTKIDGAISSGKWYLANKKPNTKLLCAIQHALMTFQSALDKQLDNQKVASIFSSQTDCSHEIRL